VLIEQVRIAEHHLNGPVTKDRCDGPEVHLVHEQLTRGGIPQASIALPGRIGAYPWCMQSLLLRDYDFGKVKKKVEPSPGSDSTQIRPPWRSTIFLQMARPMPVPGYSFIVCSRWKISKIRLA
jgi:hypothetical protein